MSSGLSITLRALRDRPPTLESLFLEPELSSALFPDNGLVLVTGVMGSGKSTLLAGVLRRVCERERRHVVTYENPIEFDFTSLAGRLGPVEQSEVLPHLGGFAKAVRGVTRRAADVVLIGEARDPETIGSVLEMAEIGVAAYATVHARSVASTPGRMISVFEVGERTRVAAALLSSLRVIVHQRLVPKVGGGRLALREWLILDQSMRESLMTVSREGLDTALENMVRERGQSLESAARRENRLGRLAPEILGRILYEKERGL
jgi:defect-in-organelle-trafficking protein DotB